MPGSSWPEFAVSRTPTQAPALRRDMAVRRRAHRGSARAEDRVEAEHHDEGKTGAERDREDPRGQDVARDAPAHRRDPLTRTDAHDARVDAVGGRDRDAEVTRGEDRD